MKENRLLIIFSITILILLSTAIPSATSSSSSMCQCESFNVSFKNGYDFHPAVENVEFENKECDKECAKECLMYLCYNDEMKKYFYGSGCDDDLINNCGYYKDIPGKNSFDSTLIYHKCKNVSCEKLFNELIERKSNENKNEKFHNHILLKHILQFSSKLKSTSTTTFEEINSTSSIPLQKTTVSIKSKTKKPATTRLPPRKPSTESNFLDDTTILWNTECNSRQCREAMELAEKYGNSLSFGIKNNNYSMATIFGIIFITFIIFI